MYMNYTANISIPKPLAELVHEQVRKGYYGSFSEVIRSALRTLLVHETVPTYKMSKQGEQVAKQAMVDFAKGNYKKITSVSELL